MYKTTVTEIGELVEAFKEESLLILFGPKATPELRA
ncbi:PTS glucitol/sorbitol transporter subunit IIA, partial [Enterococcus casseliflavus]